MAQWHLWDLTYVFSYCYSLRRNVPQDSRVWMLGLQVFNCLEGLWNLWDARHGHQFQSSGFSRFLPSFDSGPSSTLSPHTSARVMAVPTAIPAVPDTLSQESGLPSLNSSQVLSHWTIKPAVLILDPLVGCHLRRKLLSTHPLLRSISSPPSSSSPPPPPFSSFPPHQD